MAPSAHLLPRGEALVIAVPSSTSGQPVSVMVNLFFRVFLAIAANFACLVPLRILYRNGEFAAVVFITLVEVQNFQTVIKSLIWHNDDTASWWHGYGLCDIDVFVHNSGIGLYAMCLLAILRSLANSVGMLRANPLTVKEKRKRNLIHALIMFPLPIIQLAFTWPLSGQRYAVGQLIGCSWLPYPAWPYIVFFIVAPILAVLITAMYAVIVYKRFREVRKATESVLSNSRVASMRSLRTKRRLYLLTVSILVPYLPITIALLARNLVDIPGARPFDYKTIHSAPDSPYPWNTIALYPASEVSWPLLVECYPASLTAIPIFLFFGKTKDALNDYRRVLVFLGLGKIFPRLNQEYDPDKEAYGSSFSGSNQFTTVTGSSGKKSHTLQSFNSSSGSSCQGLQAQSLDLLTSLDVDTDFPEHISHPPPTQLQPINENDVIPALPHRNPFLFRTRLNFPTPLGLPFWKKLTASGPQMNPALPLHTLRPIHHPPHLAANAGGEMSRYKSPMWEYEAITRPGTFTDYEASSSSTKDAANGNTTTTTTESRQAVER